MNLKKKLTAGALVCLLAVGQASAITLNMGGSVIPSTGETILINNKTYVPLRTVSQKLNPNVQVEWKSRTAFVTAQGLNLTAKVGGRWLEANGRCFYVEDGVRLINGSVMVPIRALAAAMGGQVAWDSKSRTVTLIRGTGVPQAASYGADELYWLSRIISAESQGEPLEGKLAVGTVVLNRVASKEFPNSIYDVIFDRQWGVQFTPVANGTIYNQPTQESVAAAKLCLEGVRVAGESLYFLDPSKSSNFWTMENRTYVTTIGCHWFYA